MTLRKALGARRAEPVSEKRYSPCKISPLDEARVDDAPLDGDLLMFRAPIFQDVDGFFHPIVDAIGVQAILCQ